MAKEITSEIRAWWTTACRATGETPVKVRIVESGLLLCTEYRWNTAMPNPSHVSCGFHAHSGRAGQLWQILGPAKAEIVTVWSLTEKDCWPLGHDALRKQTLLRQLGLFQRSLSSRNYGEHNYGESDCVSSEDGTMIM